MAIQTIAVGEFFRRLGRGRFCGERNGTRQPKKGQQAKPHQPHGSEMAYDRALAANECRTIAGSSHRSGFICRHRESPRPAGQKAFLSRSSSACRLAQAISFRPRLRVNARDHIFILDSAHPFTQLRPSFITITNSPLQEKPRAWNPRGPGSCSTPARTGCVLSRPKEGGAGST